MARTANLSVSVTWGGAAAAKGLAAFTDSLNTMAGVANRAKKAMGAMMPSSLFSAAGIKGLADAKAGIEMVRGVFQTFVGTPLMVANSIVKLGAEMESAGIRMGALVGDMNAGKDIMKALSIAAMATGVPFADMAKGFRSLVEGGLSAESAVEVIDRTRNAATLMGAGAEGFNAVIGAVNQLQSSAAATEAPLKALQASGLPVMEQLAQKLSVVTGRIISVDDAMEMVRQGTVLTATAMDAVFDASNSQKVADAAKELENTVEHQLAKAQASFTEMLRNIGLELFKVFDPAQSLAGFRGAMEAILSIVKNIAETFLPVIDPKDRAKGLENTFRYARDLTFMIAEELAKGAVELKDNFSDAAKLLRVVLAEAKVMFLEQTKFWTTGFMGGRSTLSRGLISAEEHAALPANIEAARKQADKLMAEGFAAGTNTEQITATFRKLREQAAKDDAAGLNQAAKAMNELAAAAKGAAPPIDKNAAAVAKAGDAAKESALKQEMLQKNLRDQADKMFADLATPLERFAKKIVSALAEAGQAMGANRDRFLAGMRRRVGGDIEEFLKQFGPKAAEPAAAMVAGSAAAIESDIRARLEAQGEQRDLPALMKVAIDNATKQNKDQIDRLDKLVAAADKANLWKTIMALPKP